LGGGGLNPSREFAGAVGGNKGTVFMKKRRMSEVMAD